MVYTSLSGADFEEDYPHRNVADFPGLSQFGTLVKRYSKQVNIYLQTGGDDIEDTYEEIKHLVNELIEYHLIWLEDEEDEDIPHRPKPSLFSKALIHIREELDHVRGEDTGDEIAFNIDMTKTEGGFDF